MKETNIRVVGQYLNSLAAGEIDDIPVSGDVYFEDPIAGVGHGIDSYKSFISGFLPAISSARVVQQIADGEYVVTRWEVDGIFGIIPILIVMRVQENTITEAISYYDPRPVVGSL